MMCFFWARQLSTVGWHGVPRFQTNPYGKIHFFAALSFWYSSVMLGVCLNPFSGLHSLTVLLVRWYGYYSPRRQPRNQSTGSTKAQSNLHFINSTSKQKRWYLEDVFSPIGYGNCQFQGVPCWRWVVTTHSFAYQLTAGQTGTEPQSGLTGEAACRW
jgi:hypothetical protein